MIAIQIGEGKSIRLRQRNFEGPVIAEVLGAWTYIKGNREALAKIEISQEELSDFILKKVEEKYGAD